MAEKRKRSLPKVSQKKINLTSQEVLPEVDNTRKEINKFFSKLISKDVRDRVKITQKILGLIGDDLLSACNKHDLCRVVQACLKHGSDQQKAYIFESLFPHYSELASGKYSYFLAKKLLKHGNKDEMIDSVLSSATRMLSSSYGVRFLEMIYSDGYKSKIIAALLGDEIEGKFDKSRVKELMNSLSFKKMAKKGLLEYSLVLHVLYVYTLNSTDEENLLVYNGLVEFFPALLKSRFGAILAVRALVVSDAKQRKNVLKTVQPLVTLIPEAESYAYLFFIKLVQVIDDTKRVNKMISLAVNQNMSNFIKSSTGAKFLSNICPYSNPVNLLSPNELEVINENLNKTSKKPVETKQQEVFSYIFPMIAREVSNHLKEIINEPRTAGLVLTVAQGVVHKSGNYYQFVEKLANCVVDWEIMDNNTGHRILKKVVEAEVESGSKVFTKAFLQSLTEKGDYVGKLVKSRGVWVLVALVEKSLLKNKCKKLLKGFKGELSKEKAGEKALLEGIMKKGE